MVSSIFQNEEIGGPVYDGFTFGGYALTTPLVKADYPGLRAIRLEDGTVILAEDLPDSYVIPAGGGGGGGPHTHDWADVTGEPSTFPPASHDSDHDDRFSQLAHTHAVHADSDHDDRFSLLAHAHAGVYAPVEHDTTHDDRFSLLAHTHAVHADSDHDDRFALIAQGVPAGGTLGQVLAKASGTNYDTLWQSASAPAPQALDWLTDVATAGQAATNVLTYNGTTWVPAAIPAHADTDHDDRFSLLAHTHAGPLGVLGYAQVTANQTGISAITDLTGLSVAVTVGSSRRIKVTGKGNVNQVTSTGTIRGIIREGSTSLNDWIWANQAPGTPGDLMGMGEAILTPSAGAHTYKLSLQTSAGTTNLVAASDRPAFILVEDVGAA